MKKLEDVHNEHRPSTVSFTWAEYMRFLHTWEMREKKLVEDIRVLEQKVEQLREDAKTLEMVIDDRLGGRRLMMGGIEYITKAEYARMVAELKEVRDELVEESDEDTRKSD